MTDFAIAGLQLEAVNGDNLDSMLTEIDNAVRKFPWLDMVLLGELNVYGSDPSAAEAMPGPTEAKFCDLARDHGVWLVPGSMLEASDGAIYNTTPVINPDGEVVARYRKQFPWLPYEANTTPGNEFTVFDVPGVGRFGISICYDMWFPETIRAMAWMGAEVILHPSLTSDVNVAGPLGVGQSCIAGPGGEVVYQADRGREIISLKVDFNYLHKVRRNGWQNLGQPLKSFRDSKVEFPQYESGRVSESLEALGELRLPGRRNRG
jgi:predicted amidohydrolase